MKEKTTMLRKKYNFQKLLLDRFVNIKSTWISLLVCLLFSNGFGQENPSFDFERREILKPIAIAENTISMTATQDNSTISTIFDNFSVNLQTTNDGLSGALFSGFFVPVRTVKGLKSIFYTQQLRGMLKKDAGTRVTIILNLGGVSKTIKFPFGKNFEGELFRSLPLKTRNLKNNSYLATIGIIVERKSRDNIGFIQIDSFDLIVSDKPPTK